MKGETRETRFRNVIGRLRQVLEKYNGFFDQDYSYQLDGEVKQLEKALTMDQKEANILRIGLVGAMKAGKSSFLNMLLFDGKDILPRAATPMTAALTRITHSNDKDFHVDVYFYGVEDWHLIEERAGRYDSALEKEYEKYKDGFDKKNARNGSARCAMPVAPPMSKQQFEQKSFARDRSVSEVERSAKQLVTGYRSSSGLDVLLGQHKEFSGSDIGALLEPYVGADGQYTPIVNYVELSVPLDELDGLEIVDMPGLGDPIVSRANKTKDFVKECDVVLYFCRGGKIEAPDTVRLSRHLPSKGIKGGILIASRFDETLTGYRNKMTLLEANQEARLEAEKSFREALACMPPNLKSAFSKYPFLFTSVLAGNVNRKRQAKEKLSEDEEANYNNLRAMNGGKDLTSKELFSLSGINEVKKALNKIGESKQSLLKGKPSEKVRSAYEGVRHILVELLEHVQNETRRVETGDIEELRKKNEEVLCALDCAATRIGSHFTAAALSARKAIENLDAELLGAPINFANLNVDHEEKIRTVKRHEGFLGLRTAYHDYKVTTYSLATSQIDNQILAFASYCAKRVNNVFEVVVDTDSLRRSVTDEVLAALKDASFTEQDVLAPLRIAFARIKLPKLNIEPHDYLDRIHSEYPDGVAKGNEIHKARTLLAELLTAVQQDISQRLKENEDGISAILDKEANGFTVRLRTRMSGEISRIQAECADKEKNLKTRRCFRDELHRIQESIDEEMDSR